MQVKITRWNQQALSKSFGDTNCDAFKDFLRKSSDVSFIFDYKVLQLGFNLSPSFSSIDVFSTPLTKTNLKYSYNIDLLGGVKYGMTITNQSRKSTAQIGAWARHKTIRAQ